MYLLRFALPLAALICVACACADAATVLSGCVGSHKLSYSVREIASTATFSISGAADYLAITEVYPDVPGSAEYHYTVSAKGIDTFERRHRGIGFGPETCFVKVTGSPVGTITLRNLSKTPVRIARVSSVTRAEMDKLLAKDSFVLMGLANGWEKGEEMVKTLAENLHPKPEYGIRTGFGAEIKCVNQPAESVRGQLENCAKWSKQYSLPAMLGFVSWWSGTPGHVPDGLGGRFGDVKYQQFCYAPDTEQPEDENLKAILGDRYNRHYCLSVPNQWSSCPWLTMNSKLLNDYRYKRMDEAVAILKDISGGDTKWLDSIFIENEPRYWDTLCEATNSKRSGVGTLWADFNPLAVEAAKRDGVDLDPADGLSDKELLWLHQNVGKYNQECVDAVGKSLTKHGLAATQLYTHSLQHKDMFPGGAIGHPASEWACANGARTGVEGMWSQPSDFARVREWGRWANINREENDGQHIDLHLWDLRVDYMMGADLYNSYNWNAIGAQRVFDYMDEFLRDLPTVTLPPAKAHLASGGSIEIRTPMKLQAFTKLDVPVEVLKSAAREVRLVISGKEGRLIGSSRCKASKKPGGSVISFEFATAVESSCEEAATLKISAFDAHGKPVAEAVRFTDRSASEIKLSLDLRAQRALSLAVIARAKRPNVQ